MPRFAANLSMMYTEVPFLERFAAAARDGFKGVEFLFPYAHAPEEIAQRLAGAGLELVLFNMPPGNWDSGDRGLASLPGREAEFAAGVTEALRYARVLRCRQLHVMAGIPPSTADRSTCRAAYIRSLKLACEQAAGEGIRLVIEPINTRDIPGYFLNRQDEAHAIRKEVGQGNLKVQMDLYHCQIVEGDVATKLRRYIADVGHVQIAGVPERHEPSIGEVNYPYLLDLLDSLGYAGWVGCEYRPRAGTSAGLDWMTDYRDKA
jgi:2-dehydrotetronate isomerase